MWVAAGPTVGAVVIGVKSTNGATAGVAVYDSCDVAVEELGLYGGRGHAGYVLHRWNVGEEVDIMLDYYPVGAGFENAVTLDATVTAFTVAEVYANGGGGA